MEFARVLVVQDRESGQFVAMGVDGDVQLVPLLRDALRFDDAETAVESAFSICELGGFIVAEFWEAL